MKQITILIFLCFGVFFGTSQELIITEIMYNPTGTDTNWEWVEIYNKGTEAIDLSGYVLDDNAATPLSEANIILGVVEPQNTAILFNGKNISIQQFKDVWGDVNAVSVSVWPTLGNGGDTIGIWDAFENYKGDQQTQLNRVEGFMYEKNENGWPNDDGGEASIYLTMLNIDNTIGSNWLLSAEEDADTYQSVEIHGNSGNDIGSPGIVPLVNIDDEKPIITCSEDVSMISDSESCGATFPIILPTAIDNNEGEILFEGTRSDTLDLSEAFPVGETMITWIAIDAAGNTSEPCSQKITISDASSPEISCAEDMIGTSLDGNSIPLEIEKATAVDLCEGEPIITGVRDDEKELDEPYDVGETIITWKAVDASGNEAECAQLVTVNFVPSMNNEITTLSLEGQLGETNIGEESNTISLVMPIGTDLMALAPVFEISEGASVNPASGEPQNFMEPVNYLVTAQDGSEQLWTVTIALEEDMTAPSFEVNGNADDFITELNVGDIYVVGEIANIIDESETTLEITGDALVDTSVEGGPFSVVYQVSDGVNTTTITETVIVKAIMQDVFSITGFTLINADTDEPLFDLEEGMQIDINTLPTLHLDIRANTTEDVESVLISLDGAIASSRTESLLPYALFQDLPIGDYKGNDFVLGTYTVSAIPYSQDGLQGEMGSIFNINFELLDSCENFEVIFDIISDIVTCGSTDGGVTVMTNGGVAPITYSWSHDDTLEGPTATGLTAGSYTVTATDTNSCSAELTFTFKDPDLPEVSLLPFESILDNEEPIILIEGQPFGGLYSGEGVTDGEFDPSVGVGIYEIMYTYIDEGTGCENSAMGEIEVLSSQTSAVESFTLINADTNEDLFQLEEGMIIDINDLPTLHLDIRANTTAEVESVDLSLTGTQTTARTESLLPYALFQDLPIGDYRGNDFIVGSYTVMATPYSQDGANGTMGSPFEVNFELIDPNLTITEFMLVNADTNEDLFLLEEGMQINIEDLPTLHLDIRANTTADVESVRLSLDGALTNARTESLIPYALFQDLPIGDYKGADFVLGMYAVSAIPYSENGLQGEMGASLTVNFELVELTLSSKQANLMIISPNPANNTTHLSFELPVAISIISIYDVHGRLIRTYNARKIQEEDGYRLEMKALQSGTYYIKSQDKNGNTFSKQLLIKKQ